MELGLALFFSIIRSLTTSHCVRMSRPWVRFLALLELKGLTFEDVQFGSDRISVIQSVGITEPLEQAVVETEWRYRVRDGGSGAGEAAGASNVSKHKTAGGMRSGGIASTRPPVAASPTSPMGGFAARDPRLELAQMQSAAFLQLPEELQDVVLAKEVLNAVLGIGGIHIQRLEGSSTMHTALPGSSFAAVGSINGSAYRSEGVQRSVSFVVAEWIPPSMRGLCETIIPVADAFVALRNVEEAEFLGKSLVAMALGEVVSEICSAFAMEVAKLQLWSRDGQRGSSMPLMRVVADVTQIGHHLVRLRQVLPAELLNFAGETARVHTSEGVSASAGGVPLRGPSSSPLLLLPGPRLLNHLLEQLERCGGSNEESEVLRLLLRRALVPYLAMLQKWMHEGVLEDPFMEFFITETAAALPFAAPTGGAALTHRGGGMSAYKHITHLFPEMGAQTALGGETAPSRFAASRGVNQVMASLQEAAIFERRFSINTLLMPSFIEKPSRIAKMVFFTGKYCCLLRECHATLPDFSSTLTPGIDSNEAGLDGATGGSFVWRGVEDLHRTIQRSFELASQAVIQLLFSPSVDLLGHLASLKIFFLHSQGNWITDFLDNADDLLRSSRDKVRGHSLRVLLQASIARCCCANDPYHDVVGCSFSDSTLEQHVLRWRKKSGGTAEGTTAGQGDVSSLLPGESSDGRLSAGTRVEVHRCIELLQLEADLSWPLTLVLDSSVIARFNSIFRLLTWVKVCERSLASLWATNEVLASFPSAYGIKHHLTQFLRQFQFFAAHFVLEPLWSRLMARLGPAESVFAISQALNDFFTEAERGLTLSSPTRFSSLRTLLSLVARFCDIGRHSSAATLPLMEATLDAVQDQFLTALSELASPVGPEYPQLIPLLTCIDFNGFYDRHNVYHVQSGI